MMKETLQIAKILLVAHLGLSGTIDQVKADKKKALMGLLFLFAFASLIPLYILYNNFIELVYEQLRMLSQQTGIFTMVFSAAAIVVLVFGVVYAMSTFYFSKDIDKLMFLPIREESIIGAKFIHMILYEYIFVIPMLVPVFMVTWNDYAGPLFFILFWVFALITPIVPLAIGTIVVMAIMKFVNIEGKRDLIQSVSLFVFLFAVIGLQAFVTRGAADIEPGQEMEFIASLMQDPNSFMYMIGKAYPPAILATLGLTAGGLAQGAGALAHLALNGAALGGVVLAGKRLFMDGYYNKSASASKKNVKPLEEAVKTHSVYQSVYLLDQRLVLRTPVYLFNCVGTIVIIPVLLVLLPLFTGEMDLGMMRLLYLQFYDYFPIGVGAAFILMAALNPTQSTTFSREGQASWLQGVIPLKKSDLFIGKLIFPLVLQLAVIIVLAIAFALLFLMSPLSIAGGLLIGIFGSLPVIAFGLYIDRLRPKLNWDNPQKAVKQNLNVIFNMLAGLVWVVLTCVGGGALIHFFDFSPLWITLIIVVVSLIAFIGLYQMFLKINEAK